jgi:hypothetical protein
VGIRTPCDDSALAKRVLDLLLVGRRLNYLSGEVLKAFHRTLWNDSTLLDGLAEVAGCVPPESNQDPSVVDLLIEVFNKFPDCRKLIGSIVNCSVGYDFIYTKAFSKIRDEAFVVKRGDSAANRGSIALLCLLSRRTAEKDIDSHVAALMDAGPEVQRVAARVLLGDTLPLADRLAVLSKLIHSLRDISAESARRFVSPLERALSSRKSDLTQRAVWVRELQLPEDSFELLLPVQEEFQPVTGH